MDVLQIAIIVIVIIVVVLIVALIFRRRKMGRDPEYAAKVSSKSAARDLKRQQKKVEKAELKVKKAKYKEMTAPARAELNKAKVEYNNRVKQAEDNLRRANTEHDRALRDQEKKIAEINKRYTRSIANVGTVKLFFDHLEVQDAKLELNSTFSGEVVRGADLLSNGSKYPEFKFTAVLDDGKPSPVGKAIGGIGTPELPWEILTKGDFCYLFLTGSCNEYGGKRLMVCVPLDDKRLDTGKQIAEQINTNAPKSAENASRYRQELDIATSEKKRIDADIKAINDAQEALKREKADDQAVRSAQLALEDAEKNASAELGYKP